MKKNIFIYMTILALALYSFQSYAQQRYFMKIEGPVLNGQATLPAHSDEFELLSFEFGISNQIRAINPANTSSPGGKPHFTGFAIKLKQTKNIAELYKRIHNDDNIQKATISIMKNFASGLDDYLVLTLENIQFTEIRNGAMDGETDIVLSANLFAKKVKVEHYTTSSSNMRQTPPLEASWDIIENNSF